jgi:DNA-binding beta-propeller fold protein YncE
MSRRPTPRDRPTRVAPRARRSVRSRAGAALALAALAGAGCASAPRPARGPAVFFPPPPAPPRIQFLTSFTGSREIEEPTRFDRFVVGEAPELRLDKPYGVALHGGKLYVCDTNATVVVFDLAARRLGALAGALAGPGRLVQPVNISIDRDGTKYVADPERGQVVVYGRDDAYLGAFGTPGRWRPVAAVARDGLLYVADMENRVVQVLDLATGASVRTIGDRGAPEERLSGPTNLAFDRAGNLYVTDYARFRIAKYDRDGHFLGSIGRAGDNFGHFARPKGIAVDRDGRLYAVDASFSNVQIFDREGRLLMFFGEGGERPGDLLLPAQVAIDEEHLSYFEPYVEPGFEVEHLILVTSQFGPRSVNVFAFGRQRGLRYASDEELRRELDERRRTELERAAESPPP